MIAAVLCSALLVGDVIHMCTVSKLDENRICFQVQVQARGVLHIDTAQCDWIHRVVQTYCIFF